MVFKFKEFEIRQEKSAMRVGTDGVLLGAWTSVKSKPNSILDIGTGTGLIALQLAQKCDSKIIDALEIEPNAFEEAVHNFENSSWSDRLFCYHTSLKDFVAQVEDKYNIIVSNPPFYNDDFKSDNKNRNQARFTDSLSFEELLLLVKKLLAHDGFFSVIIPFKEEKTFLLIAFKNGLFPKRITRVRGTESSKIKRSLIEFSFSNITTKITELTIEIKRHQFTNEYINLVKEFYLKM